MDEESDCIRSRQIHPTNLNCAQEGGQLTSIHTSVLNVEPWAQVFGGAEVTVNWTAVADGPGEWSIGGGPNSSGSVAHSSYSFWLAAGTYTLTRNGSTGLNSCSGWSVKVGGVEVETGLSDCSVASVNFSVPCGEAGCAGRVWIGLASSSTGAWYASICSAQVAS